MAADVMWREAVLTAKAKPLIVSMGIVAASGGYYIAAAGKLIFANPLTVTGSIGIFYGKADVSELLKKIGVTIETYKTTPRADAESIYRPFTEDELRELEIKVRQFYEMFLDRVAAGPQDDPRSGRRGRAGPRVDRARGVGTRSRRSPGRDSRSARRSTQLGGATGRRAHHRAARSGELVARRGSEARRRASEGPALPLLPTQLLDVARAMAPFLTYDGERVAGSHGIRASRRAMSDPPPLAHVARASFAEIAHRAGAAQHRGRDVRIAWQFAGAARRWQSAHLRHRGARATFARGLSWRSKGSSVAGRAQLRAGTVGSLRSIRRFPPKWTVREYLVWERGSRAMGSARTDAQRAPQHPARAGSRGRGESNSSTGSGSRSDALRPRTSGLCHRPRVLIASAPLSGLAGGDADYVAAAFAAAARERSGSRRSPTCTRAPLSIASPPRRRILGVRRGPAGPAGQAANSKMGPSATP